MKTILIRDAGASALAVQVDVSQGPAVQHLIEVAVANFGGLDILFNNTGISPSGSVTKISESEWDECIAVDLRSVFLGTKYAIGSA